MTYPAKSARKHPVNSPDFIWKVQLILKVTCYVCNFHYWLLNFFGKFLLIHQLNSPTHTHFEVSMENFNNNQSLVPLGGIN